MELEQGLLGQPSPEVSCENCKALNAASKKFCSQCSYPIRGTEEEQYNFRLIVSSRKRLLSDAEDKIKSAKTILYVLSGMFFIFAWIQWFASEDLALLIVNLFICLLYLIFAAWSNKNPFGAILTAFIIFITLQIVNLFIDPSTIVKGIIIKIFVVVAFIKGIRSAMDAKKYLNELHKFKATPVERG